MLTEPHAAIAPWFIDKSLFGITKSSSTFLRSPNPLHSSHAPKGALNENILGDNSSIPIPWSGHANLVEYSISSPSIIWAITNPSDNLIAVSMESESLPSIPSFTTILSTTTSMLCFLFLLSSISSVTS